MNNNNSIMKILLQPPQKTDLMIAIETNSFADITRILESKTPGKIFGYYTVDLNAADEYGKTALMYAIEKENVDAVQRIVHGKSHGFFGSRNTNIHLFDSTGKTALIYAVDKSNSDIVRILLRALMPGKSGFCC